MLLERTPELEIPTNRGRTLFISVLVHIVLVAILILEPGLFNSGLKHVIRIEGNDYDVRQLTELELKPVPRPAPQPDVVKPLPEPPKAVERPLVEPPPPPPPPPPPVHAIAPDDILAPGARPDGQAQASRGGTSEPLNPGGAPGDAASQTARSNPQPAPPANPPQRGETKPPLVALNTNPNAITLPNLARAANQIADQNIRNQQRGGGTGGTMGPKTGVANAPNGQNFSADGNYEFRSDTKGYDFGPYMNQVLNRVRNNWLIPDSARFGRKGRVVIDFTITRAGDVVDCHIVSESGERSLDGAAKAAIDLSNPFQKLPSGFTGNDLQLRFAFFYNTPVE